MPSYFERYLAGETKQAWDEISPLVYADLDEATQLDIQQVCQETMRRVRQNAKTVINALESIGFQFGLYPDQSNLSMFEGALGVPDGEVEKKIVLIEAQIGSLPLTLRHFWTEVGSLCLSGYFPNWPEESDPLTVHSIDDAVGEIDTWLEYAAEAKAEGEEIFPYRVPIAADSTTKDNISGGDWYGIELPCYTIDGDVTEEPHNTTFVDYLRIAFRAKGFPGAKSLPEHFDKVLPELVEF